MRAGDRPAGLDRVAGDLRRSPAGVPVTYVPGLVMRRASELICAIVLALNWSSGVGFVPQSLKLYF